MLKGQVVTKNKNGFENVKKVLNKSWLYTVLIESWLYNVKRFLPNMDSRMLEDSIQIVIDSIMLVWLEGSNEILIL